MPARTDFRVERQSVVAIGEKLLASPALLRAADKINALNNVSPCMLSDLVPLAQQDATRYMPV